MTTSPQQPTRQILIIQNNETTRLEVMVEMNPDRYVLQPSDTMEIDADLCGAPFHINPYAGGIQVYPGNASDHVVKINGVEAESWIDP